MVFCVLPWSDALERHSPERVITASREVVHVPFEEHVYGDCIGVGGQVRIFARTYELLEGALSDGRAEQREAGPAKRSPYPNSTAEASSATSRTGAAQRPMTKMPMNSTPVTARASGEGRQRLAPAAGGTTYMTRITFR